MLAREASERLALAYSQACHLELEALKPGNVGYHAPGHDMVVVDFCRSAEASAPWLAAPALGLGERIYRAAEATRAAVGCNTNLGILLMCAPLAQAALCEPRLALPAAVRQVLEQTDAEDTRRVYAAIRLAAPGGLGSSEQHDVTREPDVGLVEAMRYAAARDRIAWHYADGFSALFDEAVPRLLEYTRRWADAAWGASALFMQLLAEHADSHIARKQGLACADSVRERAQALWREMAQAADPRDMQLALLDFDRELKASGINPGTTADITVGSLFAARVMEA